MTRLNYVLAIRVYRRGQYIRTEYHWTSPTHGQHWAQRYEPLVEE